MNGFLGKGPRWAGWRPESYTTGYEWDSFGRMHSITFNDGEKVTYKYDAGGLVNQVYGEVTGSDPIHYVEALEYDKFGRRAYIDRNNVTQTYYTYNAQNGRLEKLKTEQNSASNIIQDITYTYDDADNITKMVNNSPEPKRGFGGPATQNFSYDDLYRLTGADGTYKTDDQYTLAMEYDNVHNITRKNQSHWILDRKGVPDYQEGTTYDWSYTYSASHPHQPTQIGSIPYTYDLNGNQTGFVTDTVTRVIAWDEENRVKSVTDNGSATNFIYDHEGQRIAKSGSQGTTVYVNQFYSVRNGSIWTKSIMVGNERVATKVHTSNAQDVYYHGSDHLGSTNYLVDGTGDVHEHLEYFPFGEMWVDERSTTERTPYLYTGKELDEEIGLYYFGARYYDPRTSVWQSQDPILVQYLDSKENDGVYKPINLALYSYSSNSPIMHKDPDGQKSLFVFFGAIEYDRDNPKGNAYIAINIHDKGSGPFGLGLNVDYGTNFITRGVNKTNTSRNITGGNQVAIKSGLYPFKVVDRGVNPQTGRGRGLVPRLREGGNVPTLAPNPVHNGENTANGILIHGMNQNGRQNDPHHGGATYFGSEGCQGPSNGYRPQSVMEGSEQGDKGNYLLIRPAEIYNRIKKMVTE